MSGTTSGFNPAQTVLSGATLASPTVTYYVYPAGQTVQGFGTSYTTQAWKPYQLQQLALAFQTIANVTNLTFTQTSNPAAATFALGLSPTLGTNPVDNDLLGFFSFPGSGAQQLGMFNASGQGFGAAPGQGLDQGGYGFVTLIHEIGHGVGLKHPFDGGATGTNPTLPGVEPLGGSNYSLGDFSLNQGINTMMSYNNGWQTGPAGPAPAGQAYGFEGTPMAFDIAALQSMYGANTSYHTGNDTYFLPGSNGPGTGYSAIWDAGGTNTIEYDGPGNAVINLNAASLVQGPDAGGAVSYVQGVAGGFTIANGVMIQQAISGSGNDYLTGNDGNDYLNAGGGNNTIIGGTGANTIVGGTGANTILASGADLIGTAGTDDVFLQGASAAVFSGGNDTIVGGAGTAIIGANGAANADVVFGGAGSLAFINGNAASAVVRGAGTAAIYGGAGGGIFAGGTAGNNTLIAGTGRAVLYGSGDGDKLYANGSQGDVLIAGSGNETLNGVYSSGNDVFYTGTGNAQIGLGSGLDVVFGGSGASSVLGSASGNDLFAFVNGRAGGSESITRFGGNDRISLQGYGAGAVASALASAQTSGSGITLTLPDATTVTLIGVSSLNASAFV